jgi:hypothetical protein
MDAKQALNRNLAIFGWGAMFIWWGIAVMIDPITIAMAAIGTGLIMLAVNAARALNGIEQVGSTTDIGLILLAWGALDQARHMLGLSAGLSFALALFAIGLMIWLKPLLHRARPE